MSLHCRIGLWLALGASFALRPDMRLTAAAGPGDDIAIIVNRSNPVATLSMAELRVIFLAERPRWPDGRRITLAVRQPGEPERDAVLRTICRMTEESLTRHLLHLVFIGETPNVPRTLATANGVRRFVFNVPGAIGYVRLSDLDESVKAIRVDGIAPGAAGYAVKLKAPGGASSGAGAPNMLENPED
jgi:phosphate transport system substrate-binding protein